MKAITKSATVRKSNKFLNVSKIERPVLSLRQEKTICIFLAAAAKNSLDENGGFYMHEKNLMSLMDDCNVRKTRQKFAEAKDGLLSAVITERTDRESKYQMFSLIDTLNDGTMYVQIHPRFLPYVQEFKERFTTYKLNTVLSMRLPAAIVLYERFAQWRSAVEESGSKVLVEKVEELKAFLGVKNKYSSSFGPFNLRVLAPAIEEINRTTEFNVTIQTQREDGSKKIKAIVFNLTLKRDVDNRSISRMNDTLTALEDWGFGPRLRSKLLNEYGKDLVFRALDAAEKAIVDNKKIGNKRRYFEGILKNLQEEDEAGGSLFPDWKEEVRGKNDCPSCQGTGRVQRMMEGQVITVNCPECNPLK